ncbi:MAG: hypothetical protein KKD39_03390, partial [Candidatus Altiarchaeota archaeon]|nr:hypothetical protein [Candidatus Altiarchaeota archaeon]
MGEKHITWKHLLWDIIVFLAVIFSVSSMLVEVIYGLDESQYMFFLYVDTIALMVFVIDLALLWRGFHGPLPAFVKHNLLDILAVIPIFRIIRIVRFARFLKLARMRRVAKLQRINEVKAKIDEETHTSIKGRRKGFITLFIRKIKAVGLADVVLVLLAVMTTWVYLPKRFELTGGFWMCLDYIKEGTLYLNQPYCSQAPVIYYIGYLLRLFLGVYYAHYALWVVSIFSLLIVYVIGLKLMVWSGLTHNRLYTLFFLLLIYPFYPNTTITVATCFFLLGFYLLFVSKKPYSVLIMFFFSLAIFTKYVCILPTILALLSYLITHQFSFETDKDRLKIGLKKVITPSVDVAIISAGIILVFLIFKASYPFFVEYTYTSQANQMSHDFFKGLIQLLSEGDIHTVSSVAVLSLLFISFFIGIYNRRTFIFSFMLLTFYFYGVLFLSAHKSTFLGTYYFLPVYIFLIFCLLCMFEKHRKLFTLVCLITFVYPSVFVQFWSTQSTMFQDYIHMWDTLD